MKERISFAVIAAFLIVGLAVSTVSDKRRINDLQRQIAELTQKVTAYDGLPTIEEQANCDKQARAFFNEVDYKGYIKNEYSSHYNVKMKKCFVSIRTTEKISDQFWTANELYDAIERKSYGTYRWHSDKIKKYSEMPPVECSVETSNAGPKTCNSDVQFAQLASEYMDVTD